MIEFACEGADQLVGAVVPMGIAGEEAEFGEEARQGSVGGGRCIIGNASCTDDEGFGIVGGEEIAA